MSVAKYFATRHGDSTGRQRIVTYRLLQDLSLYELLSKQDAQEMDDEFNISFDGVWEMRDSVAQSGIPGWIAPYNYPDGDDILIVNTSLLEFVGSSAC